MTKFRQEHRPDVAVKDPEVSLDLLIDKGTFDSDFINAYAEKFTNSRRVPALLLVPSRALGLYSNRPHIH